MFNSSAITEGQQIFDANGAEEVNLSHDLRMDTGAKYCYLLTTVRGPVMDGVATPTMS